MPVIVLGLLDQDVTKASTRIPKMSARIHSSLLETITQYPSGSIVIHTKDLIFARMRTYHYSKEKNPIMMADSLLQFSSAVYIFKHRLIYLQSYKAKTWF